MFWGNEGPSKINSDEPSSTDYLSDSSEERRRLLDVPAVAGVYPGLAAVITEFPGTAVVLSGTIVWLSFARIWAPTGTLMTRESEDARVISVFCEDSLGTPSAPMSCT